jgi:hypothetical protein
VLHRAEPAAGIGAGVLVSMSWKSCPARVRVGAWTIVSVRALASALMSAAFEGGHEVVRGRGPGVSQVCAMEAEGPRAERRRAMRSQPLAHAVRQAGLWSWVNDCGVKYEQYCLVFSARVACACTTWGGRRGGLCLSALQQGGRVLTCSRCTSQGMRASTGAPRSSAAWTAANAGARMEGPRRGAAYGRAEACPEGRPEAHVGASSTAR